MGIRDDVAEAARAWAATVERARMEAQQHLVGWTWHDIPRPGWLASPPRVVGAGLARADSRAPGPPRPHVWNVAIPFEAHELHEAIAVLREATGIRPKAYLTPAPPSSPRAVRVPRMTVADVSRHAALLGCPEGSGHREMWAHVRGRLGGTLILRHEGVAAVDAATRSVAVQDGSGEGSGTMALLAELSLLAARRRAADPQTGLRVVQGGRRLSDGILGPRASKFGGAR